MAKKKSGDALPPAEYEQLSLEYGTASVQQLEQMVTDMLDEGRERKAGAVSGLVDPRRTVVMSNRFVVSIETGSRLAHKILRIAIGDISMDANELPTTVITSCDIEHLGLTKNRLTGHLNEVLDEILNYRIKLASVDRIQKEARLTGINVFAQATILPGKGAIAVTLNPVLREHFLNLRQDFTQYSIPIVARMPGFAASKLHELLLCRSRQYGISLLRFHIEDLVVILNYHNQGEFQPSTFVNNVIKRAVASINEGTELRVNYKVIREGRRSKDIRFYVESEWKTLEEKQEHIAWEEECLENPETAAIIKKARFQIAILLETGEGELCTEDIAFPPTSKSK